MNIVLERIHELRVKHGLTKTAMAEKIGVTPTTVSNWDKQDTMPALSVVERFCDAVGVTVSQFFGGMKKSADITSDDVFLNEWRILTDTEKQAVEKVLDAFLGHAEVKENV